MVLFSRTRTCVFLTLLILLPGSAIAGNGKFDSASKKFNMVFSVRWNASAGELSDICDEIQTASGILLDATDGANQFGIVLIANNSTASNAADYWVINQNGRSMAPTCDFGDYGEHCTLYRGAAAPAARWEEVIVHETAHYVYCVRDEYEGPSVGDCGAADCNDNPSAECVGNGAASSCLMEGPDSNDSEFCWSGNHDPDIDTEQHCDKCQSCWEEIVDRPYGVVLPAGAPVEAAPAADPIACIFLDGTPRIMLVLDRSGSMAGTRLADAKKAAKMVVDLVENGTYLGVASFSDDAGVAPNYDLQTIDNAGDRTDAKNAINGLAAGGNTNYSAGLDMAHDEFIAVGIDASNKSVIFLSDGKNNRPLPDPDGELFDTVADLDADDIVINTIGIGSDIDLEDEDRLRDIAGTTGGIYSRTPIGTTPKSGSGGPGDPTIALSTVIDIKPNFARSWALSEERTEVQNRAFDVVMDSTTCDTVRVDETTTQATFLVNWRSGLTGPFLLGFFLETPTGNLITPTMSGDPGILYVEDSTSEYAFFKISAPAIEPGVWKLCFQPQNHPEPLSITYQVFSRSPDVWHTCRTERRRAYGFGEDALVLATAFYQAPLSDVEHPTPEKAGPAAPGLPKVASLFTMNAELLSPNGSSVFSFPMSDDGLVANGDAAAGDGRFTGRIPQGVLGQLPGGSYTVCIRIANYGEAFYAGAHEKPVVGETDQAPKIPVFVRTCCTSLVYDPSLDPTGVPDEVVPGAPAGRILASVPNPFNPGARIDYEIDVRTTVRLSIYDVRGYLVRDLVRARMEPGTFHVFWDGVDSAGKEMSSGVYFAVLRAGETLTSQKLQLLR